MKHFDLFSGYGGFTLALQRAYDNHRQNLQQQETENIQPVCSESKEREAGIISNKKYDITSKINVCSSEGDKRIYNTIGFSEIDKYASAVLKYHWPNIKNYGDITKINWAEVPDFDLLTGGSPCQDLSIAGKRKGLSGERSGLFYEYMRAVREKRPKYFIWENVKGALSSNQGWDFAYVLNEMAEAGYSLWWQILNAKDFGVPQNRERIFVVGFRDGGPREIFFEQGKNSEDIKQINNPKHSNDRVYDPEGLSPCLNTMQGGMRQPFIDLSMQESKLTSEARCLQSRYFKGYSNRKAETSGVICRPVLTPDRAEKRQNGRRMKEDGEHSFTLTSQDKHGLYDGSRIRRLTPIECERLMGLPAGWTEHGLFNETIKPNGKKDYAHALISDSQRYKMCGNGVVVNVVQKIIEEIILSDLST